MKKLFYLVLAAVLFAVGCSESFDDSKIWDKLDDHESRISQLEELCKQMNTNISSLQTLVNALNQKEFITNIAPISKNGAEIGYTITFTSGKTITIYHGQDGADGKDGINGENGADGKDGSTPIIGVKKDADNIYYWTLNGEWLLDDNGNKIKAVGTDGKDGQDGTDGNDGATGPQGPQGPAGENGTDGEDGKDGQNGADGKDGITPQLKIEEGYWYISYDNGASWKQLGKATGEDGKDGQDGANGADGKDGDSFFQSVTQDDEYVYFTLADGTQITLAKEQALEITFNTEECFVNGGESYEVTYTITGADADTKIAAMAQDNYTVKVVPTDYKSGKIVVTAPSADITESQVLVFVSKGTQTIMRVLYFVKGVLTISTDNVSLEYDDTTFEIKVTTNLDYTVHIPEEASSWLSVASTRAIREETLSFAVEENTTAERRSTIVELRNNGKTVQSIAVSQNVNPKYIPASNQIFYISTDGKVVTPYNPSAFDATIVSNTYANGVGVITFDADVTTIGEHALKNCNRLKSVTIPDSVTTIGEYAFKNCNRLKSVTIPNSVTTIGSQAFYACSSLTSVIIPDNVTEIGIEAFGSCSSLISVTIPDSVTEIGDYAFYSCSSLKEFKGKFAADGGRCLIKDNAIIAYANASGTTYTIPDSVTTIGGAAFSWCESLTSITIPDSVTTIGHSAFRDCSSLTTITIPDSVTTIGDSAFRNCRSLTTITIPDSVTEIGYAAFEGCNSLTSITIPDSVTEIRGGAFYGCSSLTKAVIGSGVKKIGYSAFQNCIILNEIICKPTTPPTVSLYSGKWDAFKAIGTSPKIYVSYESVEAYRTADYWKDYANYIVAYDFDKGEIVPESRNNQIFYTATAKVEPYATDVFGANIVSNEWDSATGQGVITFDADVTTIGEYAFSGCSLTSITIPDSVTEIGYGAFSRCSSLTSVTIPDSVTEIGASAFYNCNGLTNVNISDIAAWCNISFANYDSNPVSCAHKLQLNGELVTDLVIPDSVKTIGSFAFDGCSSLTSISIPDSVTEIGKSAFYGCSSLTTITIPDSVTTIGSNTFRKCSRLTSITIPESVKTIGYSAFYSCSSLTKAVIGSGVKEIGYSVFENCISLNEIICKPTTPPTAYLDSGVWNAFKSIGTSAKIYVPTGSGEAYKAAKYWSDYASIIVEKAM